MKIDNNIKQYIDSNILSKYQKNDKGHGIDHIEYVIKRSMRFAETIDNINMNMVYVIAAYHDLGHNVDAKRHEEISAQLLLGDDDLKKFFSDEEIKIMSEAVYDHRASLEYEPRSIYGKIVSSADRNTELEAPFKRTYEYRKKHSPSSSLKQMMDESYEHLVDKFGSKGYATEKMYFEDEEYKIFLDELNRILLNRELFNTMYMKINNIEE